MATQSNILAWGILWTEEPGRLQSMGSQRVGLVSARAHTHTHTHNYYLYKIHLLPILQVGVMEREDINSFWQIS